VAELIEFRAHERKHRAIFLAELRRRGQRRCRSYWLCGIGGYVLGLLTALCGRAAIAATTAAVEKVVLRHLEQQLAALGDSDPPASEAISTIVAEEQEHHDRSEALAQAGGFWPRILTPVVTVSTELVIWAGMRL
jgi:ubiquinone biosynthesis monooxygenase Coq7